MTNPNISKEDEGGVLRTAEVTVVCMHQRHTRYDNWEIVCKDCGADLTGKPEFIAYYVPDSFMEHWYPEWSEA